MKAAFTEISRYVRCTACALALVLATACAGGGHEHGDEGSDVVADATVEITADTETADTSADTDRNDTIQPIDVHPDDTAVDDAAADVPAPGWWEGLSASGLEMNRIAGIASQMSTNAAQNEQRDFEYAQYQPYPGFRMRNGHRFDDVERVEGVWDWDRVSGSVDGAAAVGSKVLMGFDYGVDWAMEGENTSTLSIEAFAEYAGQMAGHFCSTVKEYEIWNEPNLAIFWKPSPDAGMYANMVKASYTAIKANCPDAKVAFGAMASFGEPDIFKTWEFFRLAYQAHPDICEYMDALSMHPYTWIQYASPEHDEWVDNSITLHSQTEMVRIARKMLAEAGCDGKALWFTEVGWPSYELSEETVARYGVRSLLLTAMDGVDAWCWYTFWDREPSSEGIRPHENYFGMFGWPGADGTVRHAKPAWEALTATLDRIGTYRYAGNPGAAAGLPDDVYCLAFVNENGAVTLAAWDGRDQPDITGTGTMAGGPDTSFQLDLPLPPATTKITIFDMYGNAGGTQAVTGALDLTLTPSVQLVTLETD